MIVESEVATKVVENYVNEIKYLSNEILKSGNFLSESINLSNSLVKSVQKISEINQDIPQHRELFKQLQDISLCLWNAPLNKSQVIEINSLIHANIWFTASYIMHHLSSVLLQENVYLKKIIMYIKTAKILNELKMYTMAIQIATMGVNYTGQLKQSLALMPHLSRISSVWSKDVDSNLLILKSILIISNCNTGKLMESYKIYLSSKDTIVKSQPDKISYWSDICYNCACDAYNSQKYEDCVPWLCESSELADLVDFPPENKAQMLRMLANVYIQNQSSKDYLKNSLDIIKKANSIHPNMDGIFMEIKICVMMPQFEDTEIIEKSLQIMSTGTLTLDQELAISGLCLSHNRNSAYITILDTLIAKYEGTDQKYLIIASKVEYWIKHQAADKAYTFLDQLTKSEGLADLTENVINLFKVIVWEEADRLYRSALYSDSLLWLQLVERILSFYIGIREETAEIQLMIAVCYSELNDYSSALDHISISNNLSSSSLYLTIKIYFVTNQLNDAKQAIKSLIDLCRRPDSSCEHSLYHVAQLAFQHNQCELMMGCLQTIAENSTDDHLTIFRASRYLLEHFLTDNDGNQATQFAIDCLQRCINHLDGVKLTKVERSDNIANLTKYSWNLGLLLLKSDLLAESISCLTICDNLTSLPEFGELDFSVSFRLECCSLITFAYLEIHEKSYDIEAQVYLEKCLYYARKTISLATSNESETIRSIFLVEIIVLILQNSTEAANNSLQSYISSFPIKIDQLELIASYASSAHCKNYDIAITALKIAIKQTKNSRELDYSLLARLMRTLLETSVERCSLCDQVQRNEIAIYFKEAYTLAQNSKNLFPEQEILWLTVKTWNVAMRLAGRQFYTEAEHWCSEAMGLLSLLPEAYNKCYGEKMHSAYGYLLSKISAST